MFRRISFVVAFVILVDLATGQGPPILNAYLAQNPIQMQYAGPQRTLLEPTGYMPRGEFDSFKPMDNEYAMKENEERKQDELQQEKDIIKDAKEFLPPAAHEYEKVKPTTSAPGMFSSFSNAWKSLTSLGRKTRDTSEQVEELDNSTGEKFGQWQIDGRLSKNKNQHPKSSARSFDSNDFSSDDDDGDE